MNDWRAALQGVRLVATDIDGTIAASDHRPTQRTLQTLRKVDQSGIPVVLVTGRTPHSAEQLWYESGLTAPTISATGGVVMSPKTGDVIWQCPLEGADVAEVIRLGRELGVMTSLWTARQYYVKEHPFAPLMQTINHSPFHIVPDLMPLIGETVIKMVFGGEAERLDEVEQMVQERFAGRLDVTRGTPNFVDITHANATKGNALAHVAESFGIAASAVLAIGDGDNDISMLTYAGLGVAMENGSPEAKQAARMVIGHHDSEAVADFLDVLLDNLGLSGTRTGN